MTNSTTTIKQITDLFNQAYYKPVVNKLLATPGLHNITVVIGNNPQLDEYQIKVNQDKIDKVQLTYGKKPLLGIIMNNEDGYSLYDQYLTMIDGYLAKRKSELLSLYKEALNNHQQRTKIDNLINTFKHTSDWGKLHFTVVNPSNIQ